MACRLNYSRILSFWSRNLAIAALKHFLSVLRQPKNLKFAFQPGAPLISHSKTLYSSPRAANSNICLYPRFYYFFTAVAPLLNHPVPSTWSRSSDMILHMSTQYFSMFPMRRVRPCRPFPSSCSDPWTGITSILRNNLITHFWQSTAVVHLVATRMMPSINVRALSLMVHCRYFLVTVVQLGDHLWNKATSAVQQLLNSCQPEERKALAKKARSKFLKT